MTSRYIFIEVDEDLLTDTKLLDFLRRESGFFNYHSSSDKKHFMKMLVKIMAEKKER